ncbi:MAG: adenylyl-sulfate kinase [Crocinitomicaceae bacterium]
MNASIFWLTGLSGAGKTTVASAVQKEFESNGQKLVLLDGDNLRDGLCKDLSFTIKDRRENIRRVAEVSKIFLNNNLSCICTFISPTESIRDMAKAIIGPDNFHEIYVDTSLTICENRDIKGLYKKARKKEINNFTGIDSVYEPPLNPKLVLNCTDQPIQESAKELVNYITQQLNE